MGNVEGLTGYRNAAKIRISHVSKMMRIQYFFVIALSGLLFSACAKEKETIVQTNDQTQKRVHTQEELKKTGETQPGPALEKTDAAVQVTHP